MLSAMMLALAWSPGLCRLAGAEPALAVPSSFGDVAATALAASIVLRAPASDTVTLGPFSVGVQDRHGDDGEDDEGESADSVTLRRRLTLGSGVIVHPRGVALTSARAVLAARRFAVSLLDGTPLDATLVGIDVRTDVAVLRLRTDGRLLPHLPVGDSDSVKTGDWVIAIGAPLGLEGTVAAGVITAVPTPHGSHPLASYLQTDAVMARGNAGGPLVNLQGEIIGLATLGSDTATYALPAKTLRRIYLELLEKGRVTRPWLGIATQSLTADVARALGVPTGAGAVVVTDVRPESPSAAARLRPGDLIVEWDGSLVVSRTHFEDLVSASIPGRVVKLKVRRDATVSLVSVSVGASPEDRPLPSSLPLASRRFGLDARPLEPTTGVVARDIDSWSPAGRAGIRSGDVIHEINRRPVRSVADFRSAIQSLPPGEPALIRVQRGSVILYVVVEPTAP
jgi:serine protease Do